LPSLIATARLEANNTSYVPADLLLSLVWWHADKGALLLHHGDH